MSAFFSSDERVGFHTPTGKHHGRQPNRHSHFKRWPPWRSKERLDRDDCWTLIALGKAEPFLCVELDDAPYRFCVEFESFDAFKFLCNSQDGIKIETPPIMPQNPGGESLLERLPPEILGLIFDSSDPDDFVALSLCSRTLWANAIRWAQIGYLTWKKAYSLAGTPLVYANSRLKALPQSLYDLYPEAAPTEKPEETETRVSAWHRDILLQSHRAPFPYYEHYINYFEKVFPKAGIPPGEFENMKSLFPTMKIKKDSKWLLCNKTNKEFIRMEAVVTYETEKTVSHVGNAWLTLDILLLWLIGWRGDTPQDPWAWEELEDFEGIPEEELQDILNDPIATLPDDDFWPTEIGNWAGHSLEVVTDRQLNSRWLDRTECIDRLAPKMLRTIYAFAKTEGTNSARDYWKRVFERGNTNNEVSPLMQGMNLT